MLHLHQVPNMYITYLTVKLNIIIAEIIILLILPICPFVLLVTSIVLFLERTSKFSRIISEPV